MPDRYFERLLSLLQRNPCSPYHGCFDRDFHHYKMARDFPSAPFQAAVLPLALAYRNDLASGFKDNPRVLDWVMAGIRFWARIQQRDGSFNEWFPHEHSIVATAFTLYAVSQALLVLPERDGLPMVNELEPVFLKAGQFLSRNVDLIAMNHTAGSIAALYNCFLLTKNQRFLQWLEPNRAAMLERQSDEGWFEEYGEPDAGYQSLSISFLADYWKKSSDDLTLERLQTAVRFLKYLVHPDGSVGGEYLSRNTRYLFRYGLGLLSSNIPDAADILATFEPTAAVNVEGVDDRYFTFFFMPDEAMYSCLPDVKYGTKLGARGSQYLEKSGLVIHETDLFYFIMNTKKGGAFKLFDRQKGRLVYSGLGYMYRADNNHLATSLGYGNSHAAIKRTGEWLDIAVQSDFLSVETGNPLKNCFIFFRCFNHVLGRFSFISRIFDAYLKLRKVKINKKCRGILKRNVIISNKNIKIEDTLIDIREQDNVMEVNDLGFRYVPSSMYFSRDMMVNDSCKTISLQKLSDNEQALIRKEYSF